EPNQSPILLDIAYKGNATIKLGGAYKTFTGLITDEDGNALEQTGVWEIQSEFKDKITTSVTGNNIKIRISDGNYDLISKTFSLIFSTEDETVKKNLTIGIESSL
uniref:hypothetical protein n=1 Tax=Clostridium sp. HBUAS56010 TaxID=2571127 RepID=UPI00163D9CD4